MACFSRTKGHHQARSSNKFVIVDCGLVSIEGIRPSSKSAAKRSRGDKGNDSETIADPSRSYNWVSSSQRNFNSIARADEKARISIVFRLTSRRRKINRADMCISHRRGPLHVFRPFSREVGLIVARDCCNLKSSFKVFFPRNFSTRHLSFLSPSLSLSLGKSS